MDDVPPPPPRGGGGAFAGALDSGADDESGDEGRQHHTLTLAEGRALRRELSRHQLFDGSHLVESSPETTLGTGEAAELASAVRLEVGGGERASGRRTSVDGSGRRRATGVSFDPIDEVIGTSTGDVGMMFGGASRGAATTTTHAATTLTAASGKELAAELKKQRQSPTNKSSAMKDIKKTTATSRSSFDRTGEENVLEGKEEKTRRAIKAIQRQADALMFLADAVEAKELPGLAARMRERLMSMKENYHDLLSYEGIRQRKKGALKAAKKMDLLKAALHVADEPKDACALPTHKSDKPIKKQREYKILGAKMLFAGVIFMVLLMIPFLVTQYEEHAHNVACDTAEPGVITLDQASKGTLEVTTLVGKCPHDTHAHNVWYEIYQRQLGTEYQLGVSPQNITTAAHEAAAGHGRKLLSGGGGGVSMHMRMSFATHVLKSYDASRGDVLMRFSTDCSQPVALSVTAVDTGVVGNAGIWLGLVLLISVFGLIITEIIHRTLVAFLGAASVLFILSLQHRLPAVATILTWMDHGTLALLFGMMIIVALLSRTGVFEYLSVRIVELARGAMWRLFIMLMIWHHVVL